MIIEVDIYERIRHMHEHDGCSQRRIAKILGISRNTVKKYFEGKQVPWERQGVSGRQRYVVTQEILDFIKECFIDDEKENIKKQSHTAKRIYDRLAAEKSFDGSESTIRGIVATLRGKQSKVFVPLSFEPGEAVQIDWGQATVYMEGKKIKVNLFCMRECYSADIFCIAFYRQNEESFLEGQIEGFGFFQGIPKQIIFDNAKVAVKESFGVHAVVQNRYKAFAAHYAFKCEFCNISAAHEKGLVEGLVGWVRRNIFVPVPRIKTINELNVEILRRCQGYRMHTISGKNQSVGEMAMASQACMTPLPRYKFDTSKTTIAKTDDYSTVRFDCNSYSVPAKYAGKEISVKGYGNEVVMFYHNAEIARHLRCYDKGKTNYCLEHYIDLIEKRPRSVFNAKPVKDNISAKLLEIGRRLSGHKDMVRLLRLCVDYGEQKVIDAIDHIRTPELSVEQVLAYLIPINEPIEIQSKIDIKVTRPQLKKYDTLMTKEVVL